MRRIALGLAAAVVACNSLTGVSDLEVGDDPDASVAPADAGGTPRPGTDGGLDDGGDTPLATCGSGGVCVPATTGWTPVASPRTGTGPCPAAYATATDLVSNRTFDACDCTCKPNSPTACPGTVTFAFGSLGQCTASTTTVDAPTDGGCAALPSAPPGAGASIAYQSAGTPQGTWGCTAAMTPSLQAPPAVRVCSGAQPAATGCSADQACVPAAGAGSRNCVIHDGDVECPAGLTRRSLVGTNPTDTRACSACTCATDNCQGGKVKVALGGTCFAATNLPQGSCTFDNYGSFTFTPSSGCGITTAPQVTGSLTFPAPKTLCCQ